MNDALVDRFISLFSGLDRAYGQWITATNKARFVKKPLARRQWGMHLEGVVGLGVVPIRDDDTCTWGALDIDIDDIDHRDLAERAERAGLPLLICRSKSGGAHCYTFTDKPVKAAALRKSLSRWAATLGHGQCEVFPKQDTLGDGLGSWINLPYFAGNDTKRYCMPSSGTPLTLSEFIDAAERLRTTNAAPVRAEKKDTKGMPPCLLYFKANGIPEGARNEVMFNFAVYLKKSSPETWEDDFMTLNATLPNTKPLPNKEAQTLLKSIAKKEYGYKCKTVAVSNQCDRISCLALDFGVKDTGNYHDFIITGITKVTTEPPIWILEVNGVEVRMVTSQLYNFDAVRMRCMEVFGGVISPMKNEEWRQLLQRMFAQLSIQEAPQDAGEGGRILHGLHEFIRMAGRSRKKEDLTHGLPVLDSTYVTDPVTDEINKTAIVLFRSADLIAFLQRKKYIAFLPGNDLWAVLREYRCSHTRVRIGKRIITAWYVPITEEQAEEIKTSTPVPAFEEHGL